MRWRTMTKNEEYLFDTWLSSCCQVSYFMHLCWALLVALAQCNPVKNHGLFNIQFLVVRWLANKWA